LEAEGAAPSVSVARPPRKYSVPTAIAIDTETGTSVAEFVAQYKLETDQDKYLALATWLKQHRAQPLKAGLIITLYDHLGWTRQADVTMPMRRLASKKFQWLERIGKGEYQIHQIGESRLAKLRI
jgi:hypothetical protein